eukprot:TRINITY_DN5072_c0_g1_i2.p1 TRINITY_DN5072_c0_g1~~TRINITY_DN5072_c0_g1_i2.p1  ORF type:complete len:790 (+),score=233.00 TRINITY_DN5072_c0_g1_i2:48-2372(+)
MLANVLRSPPPPSSDEGDHSMLVHASSFQPELHTTEQGDYQRWYINAERALEDRLESQTALETQTSQHTPLLAEGSGHDLASSLTAPAQPPSLAQTAPGRRESDVDILFGPQGQHKRVESHPTLPQIDAELTGPLNPEAQAQVLLGAHDAEVVMGEAEFEQLNHRVSSRLPEDIRCILRTLRSRVDESVTPEPPPEQQQQPQHEGSGDEDASGSDNDETSSNPGYTRALSTLWVGLNLLRRTEREDKPPCVKDTTLLSLLCRIRIYMAEVVIGVLLRLREKLVTHFVFWRWVELTPRMHGFPDAGRAVGTLQRLESVVDSLIGVVHQTSAEIVRHLQRETRGVEFNARLRTLLVIVTQLNLDVFSGFIEQGCAMLHTLDPNVKRTDLLPRRHLQQVEAIRRCAMACDPLTPGSCTSPAGQRGNGHIVLMMSREFDLLCEDFTQRLNAGVDALYRRYKVCQVHRAGLVCAALCGAGCYLQASGRIQGVIRWWQSTKAMAVEFFTQHVIEPVKGIYEELFAPAPGLILRDQALESMEQGNASLRTMLVDFIESARPDCVAALQEARHGDINSALAWEPVMEVLEDQIKSPVFNAARGEMSRAFLLQTIKTRVTIDQQMVEVDGLLRANRININAFATVPACMLLYLLGGLFSWVRGVFRNSLRVKDPMVTAMFSLREIHRLFSRMRQRSDPSLLYESDTSNYLNWLAEHGKVLAALSSLEKSASQLNVGIEIKSALAEDLEELKNMYAMNQIDMIQVERIWSTYTWIIGVINANNT